MKFSVSIFAVLFLYGCAGSPVQISGMDPEALQAVDNGYQICNAYGWQNNFGNVNGDKAAKLRTEIERRAEKNGVSISWDRVHERLVWVGMHRCELLMSRGAPDRHNRSSYSDEQWVYIDSGYYSDDYFFVYVGNDRVTAWSN